VAKLIKAGLFGLLIGILGVILSNVPLFRNLEENIGLGLLFQLRGVRPPPTDVVIITTDQDSSKHLNLSDNPATWPRSVHARLTDRVMRAGAKVIIFDVPFLTAQSPEDDVRFEKAIRRAGNVVLVDGVNVKNVAMGMMAEGRADPNRNMNILQPFAPFKEAAVGTGPFVLSEIPLKVNQYWTFHQGADDAPTVPVLALQLFSSSLYERFIQVLERVRPNKTGQFQTDFESARSNKGLVELVRNIREIFEGDPRLAEDMLKALGNAESHQAGVKNFRQLSGLIKAYGSVPIQYVNFYGPPRTIPTLSYSRVLESEHHATMGARFDLKDKAVFVGPPDIVLDEEKNKPYTVFSPVNSDVNGGVEIVATAFANLLEDSSVVPMSLQSQIALFLCWGLLVGVICLMVPKVLAAWVVLVLSFLYLGGVASVFQYAFTWSPLIIPLFLQGPSALGSAVLWNYYQTKKIRKKMRKAFGDYLPNPVVDALSRDLGNIKGRPQIVYGTCLFTDAANFTTLIEKLNPQQLSIMLGKYFEALFTPVRHHGGLIVDLKGDSILAIWKANQDDLGMRKQACFAALDIAKTIDRFNQEMSPYGLPTRIGLHCGKFTIMRTVGAVDHDEYRPAGDVVNMAFRVEGCNKYLGTTIAVTGDVVHGLEASFLFRELGHFKLKGKEQSIVLHELISRLEESEQNRMIASGIFAKGLSAFRIQDWNIARELFSQCVNLVDGDGPSKFYLQLCEQFIKNPPPEPWDKVVTLEHNSSGLI
jgi:adenylate cyclase